MGRLTTGLYPHVSGRWQETSVWVAMAGAGLSTRTELAVLNGANSALVETEAGWEWIQFEQAELVDAQTYRLSRLLRGQQGSEVAMVAGAEAGARILFLTGAEQRVDVATHELGLELLWRVWRRMPEENEAWSDTFAHLGVAAQMWSPAHLRADWNTGDLRLSWIRRARVGGDAWPAGEPPHEVTEAYRVGVLDGGVEVRGWDVVEAAAVYESATMAADFPSGGSAVFDVGQLGRDGLPGASSSITVTIP
jgi:hypothetical protein